MRCFFNKSTNSQAIINRFNCDILNISCLTEIITGALRDNKMCQKNESLFKKQTTKILRQKLRLLTLQRRFTRHNK